MVVEVDAVELDGGGLGVEGFGEDFEVVRFEGWIGLGELVIKTLPLLNRLLPRVQITPNLTILHTPKLPQEF